MKKIFSFLFVALFSVSLWATNPTYYYCGDNNSWDKDNAPTMQVSADGLYAYYEASITAQGNYDCKVLTTLGSWEGALGNGYTSSGLNGTDITNMNSEGNNWGTDNMRIWFDAAPATTGNKFYILVYYPNTSVNTDATNPKLCAATYLPDNREITVYFVKNNDWSSLYAYGWYKQNNHDATHTTWNDENYKMVNTGKTYHLHEIWKYTFQQTYDMVLFDQDNTHKTGDLTLGRSHKDEMYYNDEWITFAYDATLTLEAGDGGKVSFDNTNWYDDKTTARSESENLTKNIYAQANTGYTFDEWTVKAGSYSPADNKAEATTYPMHLSTADTLVASFSEIKSDLTVTKTCTSAAESTCGSYATPTPSVNKIGVATTATISATAAPAGYKLTWTLTNCELAAGTLNSAEITVRSLGNNNDASAQVEYDEDLSTMWVVRGGTQFGDTWGKNDNPMLKKSGESTTAIAYYTVNITETNQGDYSNADFRFKIYNTEMEGDAGYYGLAADGSEYWVIRANDDKEPRDLKTSGKNIELRADVTGEYVIKVDYRTYQPTITVTFPAKTPPTAIDNTAEDVKAIKRIENGQLFIIKNGVKYNALGAEVK